MQSSMQFGVLFKISRLSKEVVSVEEAETVLTEKGCNGEPFKEGATGCGQASLVRM